MMELTYRHLTESDKRLICAWTYEGEYAIYNLPSYEEMAYKQSGFMNRAREKNYLAFLEGDVLVGFVNILEEETEVFIGIGVNPDLCGRHYGRAILMKAYEISKTRHPGKPLYLEVRTWNKRAIRCYECAGFRVDGQHFELTTGSGTGTFYRMVRK